MAIVTVQRYFLALGCLAIFLLWGISLINGTVKALILASWHGKFEDGTTFTTNYTGLFIVDFPISLLVAFFFFGTNGYDSAYNHFLIDAYSTLQSAFVWLYVESGREVKKPFAVANPIIWGLIWQCFGAAISLPFYYYHHLNWLEASGTGTDGTLPSASLPAALSLPISFLVGAVLPAIIGMLPTWMPREASRHQKILAFWQPDPIWVSLIQFAGVAGFTLVQRKNKNKDRAITAGDGAATASEKKAFAWLRIAYLLAALSSTVGHVYVTARLLTTNDAGFNFFRMYLPKMFTGLRDELKLVDGPWLFLQWDLIIIALSSLSWAYVLISRLGSENRGKYEVLAWFVIGTLVLGPGATVSLALYYREGVLESRRKTSFAKRVSSISPAQEVERVRE